MIDFIVYNASGEILRTGSCPTSMLSDQAQSGETVMQGTANDATQWIAGSTVTDKLPLLITPDKLTVTADLVDIITVPNLPDPTVVNVTGEVTDVFAITDGVAEIGFDTPGIYVLRFSAFPYLDTEILVAAI